ncbi:hypothetical protein HBI24_131910 [Parastagonospora nodorum]|nr:hypothetical protein HBH51_135280 [Parastagonospora nodorum]KAH4044238.1 hypothetical protein HBH49_221850 [Parastagonospora nodorum]KAH4098857.1 hypothetical protein HBH46_152960 [Parastagonospora nodorum]KAH4116949.1 hypothetical protein HBH47_160330 [Parastagonospora nodorum]KAH4203404.1 hypothetical protein HBH42_000970 [Parastagonospora nodorum]
MSLGGQSSTACGSSPAGCGGISTGGVSSSTNCGGEASGTSSSFIGNPGGGVNPSSFEPKTLSPEEIQANKEAHDKKLAEAKQRWTQRIAKARGLTRDVGLGVRLLLTKTKLAAKKIAKGKF